jgi:GT2 family glycosyltransferase
MTDVLAENLPSVKEIDDICFLMVTCNKEEGRFFLLQNVTRSLKEDRDWTNWQDRFFVFDNDSSHPGSKDFVRESFKNVFWSRTNYGYWTAVRWFCDRAEKSGFKYLYLIESDCVHYSIGKVKQAYDFLSRNPEIGMIRTQKFSVKNKHLYDKRSPHPNSNTSDWCVQHNMFSKKDAFFEKTSVEGIYVTNMVAKMPGLHRISTLGSVLSSLEGRNFDEIDFQRESFRVNPLNGLLDEGIFDCFLSSKLRNCAGSYIESDNEMGYIPTRTGTVHPIEEVETL